MIPSDGRQKLEARLRHASGELERRLRAGEDCRAEVFFQSDPDLASHQDSALDLIYREYALREALGHVNDPALEFALRRCTARQPGNAPAAGHGEEAFLAIAGPLAQELQHRFRVGAGQPFALGHGSPSRRPACPQGSLRRSWSPVERRLVGRPGPAYNSKGGS